MSASTTVISCAEAALRVGSRVLLLYYNSKRLRSANSTKIPCRLLRRRGALCSDNIRLNLCRIAHHHFAVAQLIARFAAMKSTTNEKSKEQGHLIASDAMIFSFRTMRTIGIFSVGRKYSFSSQSPSARVRCEQHSSCMLEMKRQMCECRTANQTDHQDRVKCPQCIGARVSCMSA